MIFENDNDLTKIYCNDPVSVIYVDLYPDNSKKMISDHFHKFSKQNHYHQRSLIFFLIKIMIETLRESEGRMSLLSRENGSLTQLGRLENFESDLGVKRLWGRNS